MRDGRRFSYVIGSGVNFGNGFGGKFFVVLELPVGRVAFGVGIWGVFFWVGVLGCTGVELEAFSV